MHASRRPPWRISSLGYSESRWYGQGSAPHQRAACAEGDTRFEELRVPARRPRRQHWVEVTGSGHLQTRFACAEASERDQPRGREAREAPATLAQETERGRDYRRAN